MLDPVSPPRLDEVVSPGQRFLLGMLVLVGQVVATGIASTLTDDLGLNLAVGALAMILPPVGLALWLRVSPRDSFALHRPTGAQLGWCLLLGAGLVPAMSVLGFLNATWIEPHPEFLRAMEELAPHGATQWLFIGAVAGVLVPFAEELLFRGVLQEAAEAAIGPVRAAVAVGLIFALAHLEPWYLLPLCVVGVVLGLTRMITGSVLASAVVHGAYNLGAMLLGRIGEALAGAGMLPSGALMLTAAFAGLWAAWIALGRLRPAAGSLPAPLPEDEPGRD